MAQQGDYEIIFRQGGDGEKQANLFDALSSRGVEATRHCDPPCMRLLGLYDSVNYMVNRLNLPYFLYTNNATYIQLTLEFLSSLEVSIAPNSNSVDGIIKFRMFNTEYAYTFHEMAQLLRFPHLMPTVVCELPDNDQWLPTYISFWYTLTGKQTNSFEGNNASLIQNPAIRYFRQLLSGTLFGRGNSSKVNSKELFYLYAIFNEIHINHVPFIFSHMRSIVVSKRGPIIFGGLISNIAEAI
jgi:hypothetical protein